MNIGHKIALIIGLISVGLSGCASLANERSCSPQNLNFADKNILVKVEQYFGGSVTSDKSLIILPPTGGTNYIDRRYATNFCKAGYNVYILNQWTGMNFEGIDLELHQRYYAATQKAITVILNQINSPFIGMLGTSLGGLHASIATQLQPKVDAVFIIAAGTPIIDVIMTSDQKAMIDLRKKRIETIGFKDEAALHAALREKFKLEPLNLGEEFRHKTIGMSIATKDTTVTTKTQDKLKDLFKPKKVIVYESSHFWGIIKTWMFNTDEIIEFFNSSYQLQSSTASH